MRNFLFLLVILPLVLSKSIASPYIVKGIVINDRDQPVPGAVVTLLDQNVSSITGTDGTFNFVSSATAFHLQTHKLNAGILRYSNHALTVNNPVNQPVTLTAYDLRGRTIAQLYNSMLQAGKTVFSLPKQVQNQILIVQIQSGNIRQSIRIAGTVAAKSTATLSGISEQKTALVALNMLKVSHQIYEDVYVSYLSDCEDSLTIRLHRRLNLRKSNPIFIGDTLVRPKNNLKLTIDSISDKRCGCNMVCESPGNAIIYLTLLKNNTILHSILQTAEINRDTVEDYIISLDNIERCPQDTPDKYWFEISVFPVNSSDGLLFIEHYTILDGDTDSGSCSLLCIDFPRYGYSEKSGVLTGPVNVNDSTKAILGEGLTLLGAAGTGIASDLFAVDSLPYISWEKVTIQNILPDGTALITYKGLSLTLGPGQSWKKDSMYTEIEKGFCTKTLIKNEWISNYGFLKPYELKSY